MRVLRLCSVFEPPPQSITGRGARFDPIGGMQNHTASLTRALDARGVAHTVVTTRPPGSPRRDRIGELGSVIRLGLPVRPFRQFYSWPAAVLVPRLAATHDIVHVHHGEDLAALPIAVRAARAHRRPLVMTVHASMRHTLAVSDARSVLLRVAGGRIERWAADDADAVVTLTQRLADILVAGGVPSARVHVVPSGVVPALFAPGPPRNDPLAGVPRPRLLYVGRLHAQKQVDTLVRALATLRTPGAHLAVVGDGPERSALEALAARLGVADRVRFLGFLPHADVPAALAAADLFVLPSRYEELGSALLEAMQACLPIVATRVGGIPQVVEDGATGLLVPPADPRALAAAVDRLLGDPVLARRLAAAGHARVAAYDWSALAERIHGIYRSLLGELPG